MKNKINSAGINFLNENGEITRDIYEGDTLKLVNKEGVSYREKVVNNLEDIFELIDSATSMFDTLYIK